MISEADALARILSAVEPLPAESLPPEAAAGRFAAAAIPSPTPLPRFDQSSMDGYALRAADTPGALRLVGEQPAGALRGLRVGAGEAARIFTGAPLPDGADAVVMQEDVTVENDRVLVREAVPVGEFLRRRGDDLCEGQQLLAAGDLVSAARVGLLCAAGVPSVPVHRRPRVAIVSTGDELRPAGSPLAPGELYDANGPMLAAQLAAVADIAARSHSRDEAATLAAVLRSAADADAIVLSAGVSVGERDPVHEALRALGAKIAFWRVAVKPGKPFLFARLGPQWIFALPGNPVSAFVTAHLFVRPALRRLAGAPPAHCPAPTFPVPLGAPLANPDARPHYVRALLRNGLAFPTPLQQSHALASLAAADALLRIESGASLGPGASVPAIFMNFIDRDA